ncbi:MAG: PTS transporter subunit EIIC [Brevinemataceae bacterium]
MKERFKISEFGGIILSELQKIGQALVLPIAVLPIAGILLRLGQPDLLNNSVISEAGLAIFANLALLFAIGIAGGLSKDRDIAAGLAGGVAYLILSSVTKTINPENDLLIFGGVIAGFIGGYTYNNFYQTKLPEYLAFFGGKRFVPIMAGLIALGTALILGNIWPEISENIKNFAEWITSAGAFGLFVYGVFNRILIPFGLQHIIEKYAYFALGSFTDASGKTVVGDLNRFFAGDPSAGMFMSGFYPIMMFGLPAAAYAMYLATPKENRKAVFGLFFSVALTSLLTGVTEPIEFSFLFVAPVLFAIHALFMGLSFALADIVGLKAGFTFSGGLIDMILSWKYFTNGELIFVLGAGFAAAYFIVFYFMIKMLSLQTPGQQDLPSDTTQTLKSQKNSYSDLAPLYLKAIGGKDNINELTNCVTRLRLKLKNTDLVDESTLKSLGAKGIIKLHDSVQIVIGSDVEFAAAAIKELM